MCAGQLIPIGLSVPLSVSVIGDRQPVHPGEPGVDAGRCLPDAARHVGAGHDAGDRAARHELAECPTAERVELRDPRVVEGAVPRGVPGEAVAGPERRNVGDRGVRRRIHQQHHLMLTVRAMFGRSGVGPRELDIFNGIARQVRWVANGGTATLAAKREAGRKLR